MPSRTTFEHWPLQERGVMERERERSILQAEMVDLFHRNLPPVVLALNSVFAVLLAALLWPWADHAFLVAWNGVIAVTALINGWRHRRYRAERVAGRADASAWTRRFAHGPLLNGFAWGLGGAVLYIPEAPLHSMFVLLLICGVAAGSVASQSSLPRALYCFLFPALLLPALRIVLLADVEQAIIAGLLATYLVFMLFVARTNHRALTEAVRQRLRNEQLLGALRESEGHFRALVENALDWVLVLEPDGRLVFHSPSSQAILGYGPMSLVGKNALDLVHPDDRDVLRANLERATDQGASTSETRWRHQDGQWIQLHALARRLAGDTPRLLITARDVTERHALELELREAKEQAEAASKVKDQFLAAMSHEMRSPLHAVQGLAELLYGTPLDERQRGYVSSLRDAGSHLLDLVNDVLDFARAQSGALRLADEPFDLGTLLRGVVALHTPQAMAAGISVSLSLAPGMAMRRRGDARRVRQIVLNLVANAVKFTDRGTVQVSAEADGPWVTISVRDTGRGIPEQMQAKVFEPFTQVQYEGREAGGVGLGLAISRHLAEAMGGRLECESREGTGSTFRVQLPLPDVAAAEHADGLLAGGGQGLRAARILVADDSEMNRFLMREFFRDTACRVETVVNGRDAVEACMRASYDLILMDIQMPEMDGWEATRAIRDAEAAAGRAPAPIIALTAGALDSDRRTALEVGCTDFLAKPVSKERLLALVGAQLDTSCAPTQAPAIHA